MYKTNRVLLAAANLTEMMAPAVVGSPLNHICLGSSQSWPQHYGPLPSEHHSTLCGRLAVSSPWPPRQGKCDKISAHCWEVQFQELFHVPNSCTRQLHACKPFVQAVNVSGWGSCWCNPQWWHRAAWSRQTRSNLSVCIKYENEAGIGCAGDVFCPLQFSFFPFWLNNPPRGQPVHRWTKYPRSRPCQNSVYLLVWCAGLISLNGHITIMRIPRCAFLAVNGMVYFYYGTYS